MTVKTYCVMASFATADRDVRQSYTVFVEAGSRDEAQERGKERIAAMVSPGTSWDGQIIVYGEEQFDVLRQLGILPSTEKAQ
jgi:hypothetical protein